MKAAVFHISLIFALMAPVNIAYSMQKPVASYCRWLLSKSETLTVAVNELPRTEAVCLKAAFTWFHLETLSDNAGREGFNIPALKMVPALRALVRKGLVETSIRKQDEILLFKITDDGKLFLEHANFQSRLPDPRKSDWFKEDSLLEPMTDQDISLLKATKYGWFKLETLLDSHDIAMTADEAALSLSFLESQNLVETIFHSQSGIKLYRLSEQGKRFLDSNK